MPPKAPSQRSGLTVKEIGKIDPDNKAVAGSRRQHDENQSLNGSIPTDKGTFASTIIDKTGQILPDFVNAIQNDIHNYQGIFGLIRLVEFNDVKNAKIQLDAVSVVYWMITEGLIASELISSNDIERFRNKDKAYEDNPNYNDGLFHNAYLQFLSDGLKAKVNDVIASILPLQNENAQDEVEKRKDLLSDIANFLEEAKYNTDIISKLIKKTQNLSDVGYYDQKQIANLESLIKSYSKIPSVPIDQETADQDQSSSSSSVKHKALPQRKRRPRVTVDLVEDNTNTAHESLPKRERSAMYLMSQNNAASEVNNSENNKISKKGKEVVKNNQNSSENQKPEQVLIRKFESKNKPKAKSGGLRVKALDDDSSSIAGTIEGFNERDFSIGNQSENILQKSKETQKVGQKIAQIARKPQAVSKPWWKNSRLVFSLIAAAGAIGVVSYMSASREQNIENKIDKLDQPLGDSSNLLKKPTTKNSVNVAPVIQKSRIELLQERLGKMPKRGNKEQIAEKRKLRSELAEEYRNESDLLKDKKEYILALENIKNARDNIFSDYQDPLFVNIIHKMAFLYNEIGNSYFNDKKNPQYLMALENFAAALEIEAPVKTDRSLLNDGYEIYAKNVELALGKIKEIKLSKEDEESKVKILEKIVKNLPNRSNLQLELMNFYIDSSENFFKQSDFVKAKEFFAKAKSKSDFVLPSDKQKMVKLTELFQKEADDLIKNSTFSTQADNFLKLQKIYEIIFAQDSQELRNVRLFNRASKAEASIDIIRKAKKIYPESDVLKIKYANKLTADINSPKVFDNFREAEKIYNEVLGRNSKEDSLKSELDRIKSFNYEANSNEYLEFVALKHYSQSNFLLFKKDFSNMYRVRDSANKKSFLEDFNKILTSQNKDVYQKYQFAPEKFDKYFGSFGRIIFEFNPLIDFKDIKLEEKAKKAADMLSESKELKDNLKFFLDKKFETYFSKEFPFSTKYGQRVSYKDVYQKLDKTLNNFIEILNDERSGDFSFAFVKAVVVERRSFSFSREVDSNRYDSFPDLVRIFSKVYENADFNLDKAISNLNKASKGIGVDLKFNAENFKDFKLPAKEGLPKPNASPENPSIHKIKARQEERDR